MQEPRPQRNVDRGEPAPGDGPRPVGQPLPSSGPQPLGPVDRRPRRPTEADLPPTRVVVFRGPSPRSCSEPSLVLSAVGIPSELVRMDGTTLLTVAEEESERARYELRQYIHENRRRGVVTEEFHPLSDGVAIGAVWCLSLMLIRAAAVTGAGGFDWNDLGGMRAGLLLEGEWWRAITALFLHVDALHLGSNLVFGTVFAVFLAQHLGGGGAAFTLVAAGALGNWMNALVLSPDHRSMGASTAVFAAVGAFVTDEFLRRRRTSREAMRRWAPMVLGVLILGWYGAGDERTDVSAHVFGFLAGIGVSAWLALIDRHWSLRERGMQALGWSLAGLASTAAWLWALGLV
ncbi:rhomboid family intramembrane serine protease [Engelhardtia mirabilis]|uniref:Rhomboid family protein n=1 Tax=Engelhardtia mirabilis TaxID=2528011 RepID=A0A518BIE3_9BACT|nr:Rhomboid family protein [Planctomycetes bacterium Pla133]QDV01073.1 Rhomboid family protein [Planctomycetes bacterium Pla86]